MSSNLEKITEALLFFSIFDNDLPVGIYAISKAGQLLLCNRRVREILNLREDQVNNLITDFYLDEKLVEQMDQRLLEAEKEDRWIEKQAIGLRVDDHEVFVHQYTRAIKDDSTGETQGYLCCMIDVTHEHRYQRIFEDLPVGVYQVDENDRLSGVNRALVEILGYESTSQIEGRPIRDFYADPTEADRLREEVEGDLDLVRQRVELLRSDGEIAVASIFARKVTSPDGRYIGREGAMIDVTTEERYKTVQEELPLGLYEIRINDHGEDEIVQCNKQFAALLEFDDVSQLEGYKVRDLYPTSEEYEKLRKATREAAEAGKPLQGLRVNVRGKKGKEMVLEVNARTRRNRKGTIIGQVGAVRDATDEVELTRKVEELTHDIGTVLHSYSTTLVNVRQSTAVVLQTLVPDPLETAKGINPDQMIAYLAPPAKQFADSLESLIQRAASQDRTDAVAEDKRAVLSMQLDLLRNYERLVPYPMARLSTLRESALVVLSVCDEIQKGTFPREPLREMRRAARELLRFCNLITLHQVSDLTLEMDYTVRSLRAYVLSGRREEEPRIDLPVRELVSQTTSELHELARSRGIEFKVFQEHRDSLVKVSASDVLRALSNLLHNAIKYSWTRPGGTAWISIRTRKVQHFVGIEFENYGVPIPKDELRQGVIFRFGFRGRMSSDRRRTGTGIGLADTLRVAEEHGGSVTVRSHPASSAGRDDDYKQPFLTTATFVLPVQTRKEEEDEV